MVDSVSKGVTYARIAKLFKGLEINKNILKIFASKMDHQSLTKEEKMRLAKIVDEIFADGFPAYDIAWLFSTFNDYSSLCTGRSRTSLAATDILKIEKDLATMMRNVSKPSVNMM